MTEVQDFMLTICFGTGIGIFVGECVYLILTAAGWIKDKMHKRKEKKNTDSKAD